MGTNYYYHESGHRRCPCCKQQTPNTHIGKSSMGWAFSLRIHPHDGINSLDDWKAQWERGGAIFNEYDDAVTVDEMLRTILERTHPRGLLHHTPENMGPYGGHLDTQPGGETYDLCNYEFS